jgi:uncharacterized protein YqeY
MLQEKLAEDLKAAMRARDSARLRTIRSLRAAIMEKEISERQDGQATLTESDELAVVQKQAKQRRDAIEQFEQAGRDDLVAKEREELDIIEDYLPKQLDDDQIRTAIEQLIESMGATSMNDMGKVMGAAMGALRGKADGRRVQAIVRSLLTS